MNPPKNTKQVNEFIGLVKYSKDIWTIRTHLIHSVTAFTTNQVKFKWTHVQQKLFDDIKHAVAHNTLLAYLDLNKHFDIHADDSNFHLGAVIKQGGKPIAFYSLKLTGPQKKYTVTEKEVLSIVEILKDFCTILLG